MWPPLLLYLLALPQQMITFIRMESGVLAGTHLLLVLHYTALVCSMVAVATPEPDAVAVDATVIAVAVVGCVMTAHGFAWI